MIPDDVNVLNEMLRTGGGFIRVLALAAMRADENNLSRIKVAFPEYWAQYADLARLRKERGL